MRICVFGDSIAWGSIDFEEGGWVTRLRNHCVRNHIEHGGPDVSVYNLSISGDTSSDVLARFDVEIQARKRHLKNVIFSIGTNDAAVCNPGSEDRVPLAEYKSNLSSLIGRARECVKSVVVIGPGDVDDSRTQPAPWAPHVSYTDSRAEQYSEAARAEAKKKLATFIDIRNTLSADDLEDGLHPNTEGHRKLFEHIKSELEKHNILHD